MGTTYHADALEGKDGRAEEERVVSGVAHRRQVDGVRDVLQDGGPERQSTHQLQGHDFKQRQEQQLKAG